MAEFKQYIKTNIAEMRPVSEVDMLEYEKLDAILTSSYFEGDKLISVSISDVDKKNGSPKIGDMIARNPKDHSDQWLVDKQYFEDNFQDIDGIPIQSPYNVQESLVQLRRGILRDVLIVLLGFLVGELLFYLTF